MRILVTGGTGFLGKELVKKLLKSKDEVTVLSRQPDRELSEIGAEVIPLDLKDAEALRKSNIPTLDVVYHLAANLDESDKNIFTDNVEMTKNVIELCKDKKAKQLIFVSASGVLGETKEPAKEDFPYNPKTEYEKSKAECEKMVVASQIPYTIIRAPIILGPNEVWLKIIQAARKGFPIIGSGKNYFHLAYMDDVVDLLLLVKDNERAENQIFHVACKDPKTYEEVYRTICEELGVKMTKRRIPTFLIKSIALLYEIACKIIGKKPKVTLMRTSIDRLVRNRIISTEKAEKALNFTPKYTTEEALRKTIKSLPTK